MAAPTDRPLPAVPGRDTRPGIVLLHLYEHGPASPRVLSHRLILHRDVIDATLRQLADAEFVETTAVGRRITRHGRHYLGWILCTEFPERRERPKHSQGATHELCI